MDIGNLIKQFRTSKGYSVNKLANLSGISQSYLRDVELGKKNPTVETLSYVCDALNISLADFFNAYCNQEPSTNSLLLEIYRLSPYERKLLETLLHSMLSPEKQDILYIAENDQKS